MKSDGWIRLLALIGSAVLGQAVIGEANAGSIRALIIDGQNNHQWQTTTPVLRKILEDTGLFQVDLITTPPAGGDFSVFHPEFAKYRVVISNYNDFPQRNGVAARSPDRF